MADIIYFRRNSENSTYDHSCVISCNDVMEAAGQLNVGKDDGNTGLTSDHMKHGSNELGVHISMFLSAVVSHCDD